MTTITTETARLIAAELLTEGEDNAFAVFAATGIIRDADALEAIIFDKFVLACGNRKKENGLVLLMKFVEVQPQYTGPKLAYARAG